MKALIDALRIATSALLLLVVPAHANGLTSLGNKLTTAMSDLPRYEKLPLFDPHRKDFTCVYQGATATCDRSTGGDVVSAGAGNGRSQCTDGKDRLREDVSALFAGS
ncbi:hypothetical protein [Burkholderia gladioli]|uniref:hypothetical protein n=1 Tax=Burkholderia gladioli TaxID=28095 RepID=UPI001F1A54B9|nr:hypothetical protein [Burkholderia gladioli]